MISDTKLYDYLILIAVMMFIYACIPILFQIVQQKITSNIPYLSLILINIGFIIYIYIAISIKYYIHLIFYIIGFICITIIIFLKMSYDKNNVVTKLYYDNNSGNNS